MSWPLSLVTMGKATIPIGEVVELGGKKNVGRRDYLRYFGMLSVGSMSLSTFVTKVAGAEP